MAEFNWHEYDYCETCDASEGRPCVDLRYASKTGTFYRDTPHHGRTKVNHGERRTFNNWGSGTTSLQILDNGDSIIIQSIAHYDGVDVRTDVRLEPGDDTNRFIGELKKIRDDRRLDA